MYFLCFKLTWQPHAASFSAYCLKSINSSGLSEKVVVDQSGANYARFLNVNMMLMWLAIF